MTSFLSIRAVRTLGCLGAALLAANLAFAQDPDPVPSAQPPLDDITTRNVITERRVLAYQPIREADIMWEKRLWRIIDVREKMNLPFVAPESPLFGILSDAALEGDLTVYSTENDRFTKPLSPQELRSTLFKVDTVITFNVETGDEEIRIVENQTDWENVKRFRIKEAWFFDVLTGTLRSRILGIAPLINIVDENGDFRYEQPLFWVYYPAARDVLAQHKVVTPGGNYASTLSWEDWFEMRHFSSMITKENNMHDLKLEQLYTGLELVMQSERIEDELFNREHDMWSW